MYSFSSEVRFSETDSTEQLTLPAMLNYIQDCSIKHVAERGMPASKLREEHKQAWIVNSWQIIINKRPALGEEIKVSTIPYEFKGGCGLRNFIIQDKKGNDLILTDSIWTLIDSETARPMRVTPESRLNLEIDEKIDMEYAGRKIVIPKDIEFKDTDVVKVIRHHLDANNHVNNAKYLEIAMEYIPENMDIEQVRVQYINPALLGDDVYVKTAVKEKYYYTKLENDEGKTFVTMEFKKR